MDGTVVIIVCLLAAFATTTFVAFGVGVRFAERSFGKEKASLEKQIAQLYEQIEFLARNQLAESSAPEPSEPYRAKLAIVPPPEPQPVFCKDCSFYLKGAGLERCAFGEEYIDHEQGPRRHHRSTDVNKKFDCPDFQSAHKPRRPPARPPMPLPAPQKVVE